MAHKFPFEIATEYMRISKRAKKILIDDAIFVTNPKTGKDQIESLNQTLERKLGLARVS